MNKEGDEMEYPKFSVLMSLYIKEKAEEVKMISVILSTCKRSPEIVKRAVDSIVRQT